MHLNLMPMSKILSRMRFALVQLNCHQLQQRFVLMQSNNHQLQQRAQCGNRIGRAEEIRAEHARVPEHQHAGHQRQQ